MDVRRYGAILQQCFPRLDVAGITFIGGGTFRVFEVAVGHDLDPGTSASNTLIFLFPHGGQGDLLLQQERSLCNTIAAILPIPVPHYEYYAEGCPLFPRPVAGYRKIPGIALQDCAHGYSALQRLASQLGIIDFEEACFGDPAWDFCVLAAEYGPEFLQAVLDSYHLPVDAGLRARVAFHSRRILYHELLYGLKQGDCRFSDHAMARLRRAMAGLVPIGGWLAASTEESRSLDGYPS